MAAKLAAIVAVVTLGMGEAAVFRTQGRSKEACGAPPCNEVTSVWGARVDAAVKKGETNVDLYTASSDFQEALSVASAAKAKLQELQKEMSLSKEVADTAEAAISEADAQIQSATNGLENIRKLSVKIHTLVSGSQIPDELAKAVKLQVLEAKSGLKQSIQISQRAEQIEVKALLAVWKKAVSKAEDLHEVAEEKAEKALKTEDAAAKSDALAEQEKATDAEVKAEKAAEKVAADLQAKKEAKAAAEAKSAAQAEALAKAQAEAKAKEKAAAEQAAKKAAEEAKKARCSSGKITEKVHGWQIAVPREAISVDVGDECAMVMTTNEKKSPRAYNGGDGMGIYQADQFLELPSSGPDFQKQDVTLVAKVKQPQDALIWDVLFESSQMRLGTYKYKPYVTRIGYKVFSGVVPVDQWLTLTYTWSHSSRTLTVHMDTQKVGQYTGGVASLGTLKMRLFACFDKPKYDVHQFTGKVAYIRMYNKVLTQAEISAQVAQAEALKGIAMTFDVNAY